MKIYVDIDNTICNTNGMDYENSKPIIKNIEKINKLYEKHEITYWTARGSVSKINFYELTKKQLEEWGVKHHGLFMGKPSGDIYIDDKGEKDENFFNARD